MFTQVSKNLKGITKPTIFIDLCDRNKCHEQLFEAAKNKFIPFGG